mmetsp:Transcript_47691/g.126126  ORF Transcript_47691/g.126126 Transcript_47691/m.126126 type:complete len:300 (-) Transcript_47691:56-955(-)
MHGYLPIEIEGHLQGGIHQQVGCQGKHPVRRTERQHAIPFPRGSPHTLVKRRILQEFRVLQGQSQIRSPTQFRVDLDRPVHRQGHELHLTIHDTIDPLNNVDIHLIGSVYRVLLTPPDLIPRSRGHGRTPRDRGNQGTDSPALVRGDIGLYLGRPRQRREHFPSHGRRGNHGLKAVGLRREGQSTFNHLIKQQIQGRKIGPQGVLSDLPKISQAHVVHLVQHFQAPHRLHLGRSDPQKEQPFPQDVVDRLSPVVTADRVQVGGVVGFSELVQEGFDHLSWCGAPPVLLHNELPSGIDYE